MKLKGLISALIVFTLVMTCAMSAVSAASCSFTTTTTYSTSGDVAVETTVATGLSDGSMVSYVIYDLSDSASAVPTEDNIRYIDQKTASSGSVSFTVTDTIAKLGGANILMGSDKDTLTANVVNVDDVVSVDSSSALIVYTGEEEHLDPENNSVTFLVSQSGSSAKTGINVYAYNKTDGSLAHEFLGLENLSDSNYYAIQLVDETNTLNFTEYSYVVIPYVVSTSAEMSVVKDTAYYVEAE